MSAQPEGQEGSILHKFSISGFDEANGVAVDTTSVYVVGRGTVAGGGMSRGLVRKYTLNGNALWTRQLDPTEAATKLVAADATGVYVVWGGEQQPAFVRKYNLSGNELWTRQLFGSIVFGSPRGVTTDATGV